jgi:hypothetical protein
MVDHESRNKGIYIWKEIELKISCGYNSVVETTAELQEKKSCHRMINRGFSPHIQKIRL